MNCSFDDDVVWKPTPAPSLSVIAHCMAYVGETLEPTIKAHLSDFLATLPADRRQTVEATIWSFGDRIRTYAREVEENIERLRELVGTQIV